MYVCISRNDWIHLYIVNNLSNFAFCLSNCSYKMDAKCNGVRLLELIHTTRSQLHAHLNTHTQTGTRIRINTHSQTYTHTRTTHTRTYVLFKPWKRPYMMIKFIDLLKPENENTLRKLAIYT